MDLKPENILVFGNVRCVTEQYVKVADFGLGKYQNHNKGSRSNSTSTGDSNFIAPETRDSVTSSTSASDIWSLSMIFVCLVLNEIPKRRMKDGTYKEISYHRFVENGWDLPTL